ncbi:hypothetical protein ACKLNR_007543 [Fusarium oxysporum f. sp. zingiberi]
MNRPALSAVHDLHQISPNSKSGSRVPGERKPLSSHHNFAPVRDGLYLTITTALTPDTAFLSRNHHARSSMHVSEPMFLDYEWISTLHLKISRDSRRGCNKNPDIFVEQG